MDPEEDELEALGFVDESDAPATPMRGYHQARSRAIVLPETRMTASPEGGGTIRGGLGTVEDPTGDARIEEDAELEDIFEKDRPAPPRSERAYRDALRAREDEAEGGEHSFLDDVLSSASSPIAGLDESQGGSGADRRLRRRAARAAEEIPDDPIALLMGAGHGLPIAGSWLDEIAGAGATVGGVLSDAAGLDLNGADVEGTGTEGVYERTRDAFHDDSEAAARRSPYAYGTGEVATMLGTAPLLAEEEAGSSALTAGQRIARGIRQGALFGALSGAGESDADGELLDDTLGSGVGGAVLGGLFAGGGEAVRGLGRTARRIGSSADRARVASVAGGSSVGLGDPVMRLWEGMPGGVEGQAERIRRMRLVSPAATAQDVLERSTREADRVGDEVLGSIRADLEASGQGIPTANLVDALEQYAQTLDQNPELAQWAAIVRRRAQRYQEAFGRLPDGARGPMPTVPYARAMEALRSLGEQTSWVDPALGEVRPPTAVSRGQYRALRDSLDDHVEELLGPERRGAYQEGRRDWQTAHTAAELAESALGRQARSRGISPSDYAAGIAGGATSGNPLSALGSMLANRAWRGREGSLRATGSELVQRLMESGAVRRLGEWGPALERALERGVPAFAAAHYSLSQTDPAYRERIRELEAEQGSSDDELPEGFTYEDAAAPQ